MKASAVPGVTRACASLVLVGSLLAGCGEGRPSPTHPTATVTALSVTQPPRTLKAGDTYQLVATATLSDGRTATTGFDVRWVSSDEAIATVNGGGLVTAHADGSASITASAAPITASATIQIRTGGLTLTGLVTETAPRLETPVLGARVTVIDGVYQGVTALTDGRGMFSLADVNGPVKVRVSAPYFEDAEMTADAGSSVVVRLAPVPGTVVDTIDWLRPSAGEWAYQGQLTFFQHGTGPAHLVSSASIYYSDSTPTCNELRDDKNRLLWQESMGWQFAAEVTLTLTGGRSYTLKVYDCDGGRRTVPTLSAYRLRAEHPY